MACSSRRRLFRLSRRADQWPGAIRVPISRQTSLASATLSAQPESQSAMDADDETGGRVSPEATDPSSLAQRAVRRQPPEVGAECPNWARSDLSGGCSEMSVPTGNTKTTRHIKHRPNSAACSRAERKKSRNSAPCATIRRHTSRFRSVCRTSALRDDPEAISRLPGAESLCGKVRFGPFAVNPTGRWRLFGRFAHRRAHAGAQFVD